MRSVRVELGQGSRRKRFTGASVRPSYEIGRNREQLAQYTELLRLRAVEKASRGYWAAKPAYDCERFMEGQVRKDFNTLANELCEAERILDALLGDGECLANNDPGDREWG
ncbi:MAG: hypothetical protein ACYCYO_01675 [Bacilli bacterium]